MATNTKTLHELECERLTWSLTTFGRATPLSSLVKLEKEIAEVRELLSDPMTTPLTLEDARAYFEHLKEEYVNCLMCLLDSAGQCGFSVDDLTQGFADKLAINKARTWVKNDDNTYSHVK